jgi:hypothetical protein
MRTILFSAVAVAALAFVTAAPNQAKAQTIVTPGYVYSNPVYGTYYTPSYYYTPGYTYYYTPGYSTYYYTPYYTPYYSSWYGPRYYGGWYGDRHAWHEWREHHHHW